MAIRKKVTSKVKETKTEGETVQKVPGQKNRLRSIFRWIGWGIVYIFVFYLGNLAGEYVAARMPLYSLRLPKFIFQVKLPHASLPKLSVKWDKEKLAALVPGRSTASVVSHTKPLIIAGNFLAFPLEGATQEEKDQFEQAVKALVVPGMAQNIVGVCELDPAFVGAQRGSQIQITNQTEQDHKLMVHDLEPRPAPVGQTVTVQLPEAQGIYPVSCDGSIAGFYIVTQ